MAGEWADARPDDHRDPLGLSRVRPCVYCEHEEHAMECQALIDPAFDVLCPCRDAPVPGIYPPVPRVSRFAG